MSTCSDDRSASEYTAIDGIAISRHVRMIRTAISPRLATRTLGSLTIGKAYRPGPGARIRKRHGPAERGVHPAGDEPRRAPRRAGSVRRRDRVDQRDRDRARPTGGARVDTG